MGIEMQIAISVVYSPGPREVIETSLQVELGTTLSQVLACEALAAHARTWTIDAAGLGVWGKKMGPNYELKDNDRIEIFRSLRVDPKVARRERFVRQGAKKSAGLFARRRAGAKAGY
jgi:putative ubiquitin-RnfH superfamily antitoxin RatB of RatAB toxin-antitoxin module